VHLLDNPTVRLTRILMLCAASALALGACRGSRNDSPVIAKVNGQQMTKQQFERFLLMNLGEIGTVETSDAIRSQMLDEFIRRQLVVDAARRAGLAVADSEIDQLTEENPHLKSTVATAGNREELAADRLIEKYYRQVVLKDLKVTQEEIEQYLAQNQSRLAEHYGFYVREIRVQSKEEADKLRHEVAEGHRDFAAIARIRSDAANASEGGLSRYEEGQLPDALEKAIRHLAPGDISPVIESGYGFHIFKLEKRIQPHPAEDKRARLDDRRRQLTEELLQTRNQQAVNSAIETLVRDASITINDAALGFTYVGALRHN